MHEFCAKFFPLPVSYFPHLSNLVDIQGNKLSIECIESSLSGPEQLYRQDDGLEMIAKDNSLNYNRKAVSNFLQIQTLESK